MRIKVAQELFGREVYGYFTTFFVYNGTVEWFDLHLKRMDTYLSSLYIHPLREREKNEIRRFFFSQTTGRGRIVLSLGKSPRILLNFEPIVVTISDLTVNTFLKIEPLGPFKRFPPIYRPPSGEEVFLVDRNTGYLLEGAISNVFAVDGKVVYTPPADGKIVNGVARRMFMRYLELSGYDMKERYFPPDFLKDKKIFCTNALRGVMRCRVNLSSWKG